MPSAHGIYQTLQLVVLLGGFMLAVCMVLVGCILGEFIFWLGVKVLSIAERVRQSWIMYKGLRKDFSSRIPPASGL